MRILNLGAGVQSTAVFLMAHEGLIESVDHAIFSDTQEEPRKVYEHLKWMRTITAPVPLIHVTTAGKLGDHLMVGQDSTGGRFASIPCFTGKSHLTRDHRDPCNEGIVRRQCTKEYKIEPVERVIRRTILNLKPRQRIPKGTVINQIFGISSDEKGRARRIKANWDARTIKGVEWNVSFPLIEIGWTRSDCEEYLKTRVPHKVTRSACVFCPFKSSSEWLMTKAEPEEWARAVEIGRALRIEGNVVNRNMDQSLYLHRKCIPLELVDLEEEAKKEAARKSRPLFDLMECEGMCGM